MRVRREIVRPWERIKAIGLAEPVAVKRANVEVYELPRRRGEAKQFVVVNRRYRRQSQGRVNGFSASRPKALRLTPVDWDGRASVIRVNRERRRAARSAARRTAVAA